MATPTPAVPSPAIPIPPVPLAVATGQPQGECEKYLKPEEGKAILPDRAWNIKNQERKATNPDQIAQQDDPSGVPIPGGGGVKKITVSGLWCQYAGGQPVDYVIYTFPSPGSAATTGRRSGAMPGGDVPGIGAGGMNLHCSLILGAQVQETSDYGGPACKGTGAIKETLFINGSRIVSVQCGECTPEQRDQLAKTIAGHL
ncbi:MAG: hypothetical protein HY558_00560 [Euryarchaeota archaeon]|nr:hypothetical protein [Euryarchaeota archaeon]